MGFIEGKRYRFTNMYWTDKALNVYGTNAASTGRNVCLYDNTPTDNMQVWKYSNDTGIGVRLHSVINDSYVLDRSSGITGSYINNAHICSKGQTSARDSALVFESAGSNVYRIRLANGINNKLLYLTAANNYAGMPTAKIDSYEQLTKGIKNVYWTEKADSSDLEASAKQCWKAVLAENEIKPTVTYRIKSNTSDGRKAKPSGGYVSVPYYLNCASTSVGSNANAYLRDGTTDQIWNYNGTVLWHEKSGETVVLSRPSISSEKVQLGSSSFSEDLSKLSFEKISGNNYKIKIGNGNNAAYLTASVRASADNTAISVSWSAKKAADPNNTQSWELEKLIKVTNMPSGVYTNDTEYFHPNSGWISGTYAENNGTNIFSRVKALYQKCYNLSSAENIGISQCFKNLYGALTVGSGTWQDGTFHLGCDFNRGKGTAIYAPYNGNVVKKYNSYGAVTIEASGNKYYTLMHMDGTSTLSIGGAVTENTPLGTEGKVGVAQVHLHVEAENELPSAIRSPITSSNSPLTTVSPF